MEDLFSLFRINVFTPHLFVVLFISCICFTIINDNYHYSNIKILLGTYIFITPISALLIFTVMTKKYFSYNFKTQCMIRNSWLPLIVSGAIGLVILMVSVIIYNKYFGGFRGQVVGLLLSSLAYGFYLKVLIDSFTSLPRMIKEEIELDELNYRLIDSIL